MPVLSRLRRVLVSLCWSVCCAAAVAGEAAGPPAEPARLEGRRLDGQPYSLVGERGKVVLVVFWSTACAVCRDVLPELRANYLGWRGKPFELVTVATDADHADVLAYERLLQHTRPMAERFPSLWRHDPAHRDGFGAAPRLPAAFLVDAQGHVVERFAGRIPPEAWDRIAELMP